MDHHNLSSLGLSCSKEFIFVPGWVGLDGFELNLVSLGISEAITLHLLLSFSLVHSFFSLSGYDQAKNWHPSAVILNLNQSC